MQKGGQIGQNKIKKTLPQDRYDALNLINQRLVSYTSMHRDTHTCMCVGFQTMSMRQKISCISFSMLVFHTLPISIIEKPPMKRADADPKTCSCSLREAYMETDMSGLVPSDLGIECTKCSGE
jgi:hypothetical protein